MYYTGTCNLCDQTCHLHKQADLKGSLLHQLPLHRTLKLLACWSRRHICSPAHSHFYFFVPLIFDRDTPVQVVSITESFVIFFPFWSLLKNYDIALILCISFVQWFSKSVQLGYLLFLQQHNLLNTYWIILDKVDVTCIYCWVPAVFFYNIGNK